MSKYKQAMIKKGIMQKELLDGVRKADARVDKPLLSKIVNDICLPNRVTLKSICNVLQCEPLDIYEKDEINLAGAADKPKQRYHDGRSHGENIYNLTVELDRDLALRVFSKESLRLLGFLSATDAIRQYVIKLDNIIEEKKKAAKSATTLTDGN